MIFFCPERFYDFFPPDRLRNFFVLRDCMIFLFQEVFLMLFKNLDTVPYWLLFSFLASLYLVCRLQTGLVHARACITHLVVTTNYTLEEN